MLGQDEIFFWRTVLRYDGQNISQSEIDSSPRRCQDYQAGSLAFLAPYFALAIVLYVIKRAEGHARGAGGRKDLKPPAHWHVQEHVTAVLVVLTALVVCSRKNGLLRAEISFPLSEVQ